MRDAIWATFLHYSSTDQSPHHEKCSSSWCTWQQAAADNKLESYKHKYNALPADVLEAMKPIYEDLSKDALLERCVGGFTQNSNESYNQLVWKIAPKTLHAGAKVVEIAAYVAAGMYNEGNLAVLLFLHSMDVELGPYAHQYASNEDEERISKADRKSLAATKEERIRLRLEKKNALDHAAATGELLYGAGIDDSV